MKLRAVLGALILALPAFGLDPAKSLTQYLHRIQQIQQGLPQATIFSILQSHDGYLWVGTQRGLSRFDGVRFTPFAGGAGVSLENAQAPSFVRPSQSGRKPCGSRMARIAPGARIRTE